jgi:hypothetical protein
LGREEREKRERKENNQGHAPIYSQKKGMPLVVSKMKASRTSPFFF